jgi:hypothetical protein
MKKFLIIAILLIIVFLSGFIYWKYFFTYSEGYRAGLFQKFSYKGTLFKTYEGEIILSSVQSNKNVPLASEKFFFSVTDKTLATKMIHLEGYMVVVHYRMVNGILPWMGDTKFIVDSVKVQN